MKALEIQDTEQGNSSTYPKEMPVRYLRVFQVLDGYREGKVDHQEVQAINKQELREARAWMRNWMNGRMEEAFPEISELDEF